MTTFADVLSVKQIETNKYSAEFEDAWCVGTVPNGGYVTSAFLRVASLHMQLTHSNRKQPDILNLHLEFMRRTQVGQAIFTVKDVKLGSRISNLHLTVAQVDDRKGQLVDEVEGYVTMSNLEAEAGPSLATGYKVFPTPLSVSLPALSENKDENYLRRGRDLFAEFRKVGQNIIMHLMRPEKRPKDMPKALIDQWILFRPLGREGRFTNDSLGLAVDVFPQIIEQYVNPVIEEATLIHNMSAEEAKEFVRKTQPHAKYWYPTLSLNLDVKKALPADGVEWLFVRVQAKKIQNGRFDLQIHVLDDTGDLVALSTHSSLVVDSSRNLSRPKKEKPSKL